MCMSTVDFTLQRDKNGEYYGIGYKSIEINEKDNPIGFRIGRWKKDTNYGVAGYPNSYELGFHVFLDKQSAISYGDIAFEVHFKDVVAFGTNSTGYNKPDGNCIIARRIKVVKRVY